MKFKVGDEVVVRGVVTAMNMASRPDWADATIYVNTYNGGLHLFWLAEVEAALPSPLPSPKFKVGDRVVTPSSPSKVEGEIMAVKFAYDVKRDGDGAKVGYYEQSLTPETPREPKRGDRVRLKSGRGEGEVIFIRKSGSAIPFVVGWDDDGIGYCTADVLDILP
jgi:hypothetical protein